MNSPPEVNTKESVCYPAGPDGKQAEPTQAELAKSLRSFSSAIETLQRRHGLPHKPIRLTGDAEPDPTLREIECQQALDREAQRLARVAEEANGGLGAGPQSERPRAVFETPSTPRQERREGPSRAPDASPLKASEDRRSSGARGSTVAPASSASSHARHPTFPYTSSDASAVPEGWSNTPRIEPPRGSALRPGRAARLEQLALTGEEGAPVSGQTTGAFVPGEPVQGCDDPGSRPNLDPPVAPTSPTTPTALSQRVEFPAFEGPSLAGSKLDPDVPGAVVARSIVRGEQQPARVVNVRIDWLGLAFQVLPSTGVLDALLGRIKAEASEGPVWVSLAGAGFMVIRAGDMKHVLSNNTCQVEIEPGASEGWNVAVIFSGKQMAVRSRDSAVAIAERLAAALGTVRGRRVRRVDLAVDVAGWQLSAAGDVDRFVKPRQAGWGKFRAERDLKRDGDTYQLPTSDVYVRNERVTGIVLCPKGALKLVAYDKRAELATRDKWKGADEEARWRERGWDGESGVVRFEFRVKAEALYEMVDPEGRNLRDGVRALDNLDAIWAYLTHEWVRLVDVEGATRKTRAKVDPRWQLLQQVRFAHEAQPIARKRRRGGASAAQARGATRSFYLATILAEGETFRYELPVAGSALTLDISAIEKPKDWGTAFEPAEAHTEGLKFTRAIFDACAVKLWAESVELEGGAGPALAKCVQGFQATMARHSVVPEAA